MITLTTDFGLSDGYVGAMKGVILSIAPQVRLVDISHQIPPGDVRQAAYVLSSAAPYFPPGVIHVLVVDPGVGGERRAIAARTERAIFVAPDNGLISLCLTPSDRPIAYRQLSNPRYQRAPVSFTFHGRDIFAPAAAHLAAGADFDDLGPALNDPVTLAAPDNKIDPVGGLLGEVWHVDHFGNLITTLGDWQWNGQAWQAMNGRFQIEVGQGALEVAGRRIVGLARTYVERSVGELMILIGSAGYLEIAVRDGSAAQTLGVQRGARVRLVGWHGPQPG